MRASLFVNLKPERVVLNKRYKKLVNNKLSNFYYVKKIHMSLCLQNKKKRKISIWHGKDRNKKGTIYLYINIFLRGK